MMIEKLLRASLHLVAFIPLVAGAVDRPSRSQQGTLSFSYEPNITRVTIDNPPINLFDSKLASDFLDFLISIQPSKSSSPPKVVIFDSADPEFFIAHIDLTQVILPSTPANFAFFDKIGQIASFLRNTTTSVFISEIDGRTSGFGDEVLLQTDLRYAGPNTRASQIEAAFGLFPGGGGLQALPRLINRGRGLQYVLSSTAVDGQRGAELGWFNEYYSDKGKLKEAVNEIAKRIALFPAQVINGSKSGLPELYPGPEVYARDTQNFFRLNSAPEVQALLKKGIKLGQNQTRSRFELGIPDTLIELYQ